MPLLDKELDMPDQQNGQPTLGEIGRSQSRMEGAINRIEHNLIPEALKQVADVRHRVANLEQRNVLGETFLTDYNQVKETMLELKTQLDDYKVVKNVVTEMKASTDAIDKYRKHQQWLWLTVLALVLSIIVVFATRGG